MAVKTGSDGFTVIEIESSGYFAANVTTGLEEPAKYQFNTLRSMTI